MTTCCATTTEIKIPTGTVRTPKKRVPSSHNAHEFPPYWLTTFERLLPLFRSPWSSKYDPPLKDGTQPSAKLREQEVQFNKAFDVYRDLYVIGRFALVFVFVVLFFWAVAFGLRLIVFSGTSKVEFRPFISGILMVDSPVLSSLKKFKTKHVVFR